ncbi:MAG: hypothetical protein PVH91_04010 [Pseudomonadales bacterium]|jgi:hypothetical protein
MSTMNLKTFTDHLDRFGPDLVSWPEPARQPARVLLDTSEAARAAHRAATTVDRLLHALPAEPAPSHLPARILAAIEPTRQRTADPLLRLTEWFAGALWRPVLAACIPLAVGFALGVAVAPGATADQYLAESLGLLPFSASFDEELPDAE